MSEEKEKLAKTSSESQPLSDPNNLTVLSKIEECLAKANSAQETILWTQVRGEVVQ